MSRFQQKLVKAIASSLPQSHLHDGIIVLDMVDHLARCVIFEGSSKKGACFIWVGVLPLFHPISELTLNYSWRCRPYGSQYIEIPQGDVEVYAGSLMTEIKSDIASLMSICSLGAFVEKFPLPPDELRPNKVLTSAIAEYLRGNKSTGIDFMRRVATLHGSNKIYEICRQTAIRYLEADTVGSGAFEALVAEKEKLIELNVLGLSPRKPSAA